MKKIISFSTIFFILVLCGCKSNPGATPNYHVIDNGTQVQPTSSFNDEHYIWEKWIYPSFK